MRLVRSLKNLAAGYFIENCNRIFCFVCGPGSGPKIVLANMGSRYSVTFLNFFELVGSRTDTKKESEL